MKYLILFLISFNVFGMHTYKIIPNDSKLAGYGLKKPTLTELNNELVDVINRAKWLKGSWNGIEENSIASRSVLDFDTQLFVTEYYHPENFTLSYEDITIQEQERSNKANAKQALRAKLKTQDLSVPELNELLR